MKIGRLTTGGGRGVRAGPFVLGCRKTASSFNVTYLRSRDIVSGRDDQRCARVSIIVVPVAKGNFRWRRLKRVTGMAWQRGHDSRTTGTLLLLLIFTTVRSSWPSATATPSTAGYRVGGGRDVKRYTRPRSALPPPLRRFPTDRLRPGPPVYDETWRLYALAREGRCTGGHGGDKGSVTLPSSAPHAHAPPAP